MIDHSVGDVFFTIYISDEYYASRFEWKQTMALMDLALRHVQKSGDQIPGRVFPFCRRLNWNTHDCAFS
jgi:hypothetical protein